MPAAASRDKMQNAWFGDAFRHQLVAALLAHAHELLVQRLLVNIAEVHIVELHAAELLELLLHAATHFQRIFEAASDRLLIVGFSQGTMMALHVGLRRPEPVAGIVGISGMLVAPERLRGEIRSRPPVLLIHGTEDDVVPFRSMELASTALSASGVTVETHVSPGVGHSVGQDGLAAATAFAARVLV